ncbi:MAG TPA: gliding motility-associated C-terminal domain-containing protein [Bacteroidales bacterium]|nr:gliding motility-associated C-terminal domain-containing protein [Bacteroidales bacterium]HOK99135.1 gliding motility-associated C-terminal domain-containing protein [Bacteroidales bacterium]HPO65965.1 gliding motility-associated C-terminal domain-containing protein [Bacteroidales bacterium]
MKYLIAVLFSILVVGATLPLAQAQLPAACTQSWVRYAANPDPLMMGTQSHFTWIFDPIGVKEYKVYGNGDSVDILWSNRPGRYSIGISEVTEFGCTGDTVWNYVTVQGVLFDIGPDKEVCKNDSFTFDAGSDFASYLWNDTATGRIFRGIARTTDTIRVTAINEINCKTSDSAILIVRPRPNVNIVDLASGLPVVDTMLCGNVSITLDAGMDGTFYTWNTGDITNTITVSAIDPLSADSLKVYAVHVENVYGCTAEDSVLLRRCLVADNNGIPNVFTPNGDGKNDVWRIPAFDYFPNATVEVYDRWNRWVYRSHSRQYKPWDGKLEGKEVPMGTYYYLIKGMSNKEIKGNVTIIR